MSADVPGDLGSARRLPVRDFDFMAASDQEQSDEQWRNEREGCPIAWSQRYEGHWVLAKNSDIGAALRDWETFSSAREDPEITIQSIVPLKQKLMNPLELDPPEWHENRRVLAPMLSPSATEHLQPRVSKWATHFIDEVIESGHMDLATDLAGPVPTAVTMEWLGFPPEDWSRANKAFHDSLGYAPGTPEQVHALQEFEWLNTRTAELVADRQAYPIDDGISSIVTHKIEGKTMSAQYAEAMIFVLVGGGVETTTGFMLSALVHLHYHPELRRSLVDDPALFDLATEEFLRMYPPVRVRPRRVAKDTEVGGFLMREGDKVLCGFASATVTKKLFPMQTALSWTGSQIVT